MPDLAIVLLTLAGIVVPAAAATAVVRRWYAPIPWPVAGGLLALTLLFLGSAVFTTALPVPVDEVTRGYPYRGLLGEASPKNPLTNDTVKLFLPWMQVVREEFTAGRLPLWNRYSFSGYPLLANGESAPFYPPFLATLFVPLPEQIISMAGLKLFLALLFGFAWLRRLEVSGWFAAAGSTLFAFSTFNVVYLYYSTSAVTLLLPMVAFAISYGFEQRTSRALWLIVAAVTMVLSAGHPESAFHVALTAALLLAVEIAVARRSPAARLRAAGFVVAAALLGTLIAAPNWLPVLEQIRLSSRFAEIGAEGGRLMTSPMPAGAGWTFLSPNVFGNPARGTWNWLMNYSVVASSYAGLLTLAFLPAALFSGGATTRDRLLALLALAIALIAMDWTAAAQILNSIPPLSLAANDKWRFAAVFLGATATARSLQRMQQGEALWELAGSVAAAGGLIWLYWKKGGITLNPIDLAPVIAIAVVWTGIVLARTTRRKHILGIAAILAVLLDAGLLNREFNALSPRRHFRPELPVIDALRAEAPAEPFRIAARDWTFLPNASAQYGLEDIRGSDPMSAASYTSFLRDIGAGDRGEVELLRDFAGSGIDFLNVLFVLTEPGVDLDPGWERLYRGPDGNLYRNRQFVSRFFAVSDVREPASPNGLPLPVDGRARVTTRQITPTHFSVEVENAAPLFVASSQPALPGWRVVLEGKRQRVRLVKKTFLGFVAPAGRHRFEVIYLPESFAIALLLMAVGLLAAATHSAGMQSDRHR